MPERPSSLTGYRKFGSSSAGNGADTTSVNTDCFVVSVDEGMLPSAEEVKEFKRKQDEEKI